MIDISQHIQRVNARHPLLPAEIASLQAMVTETRRVAAHSLLWRANEKLDHSAILVDGFMCRTKILQNGRRHIFEVHVAGDFVDLHSYTLKRLDHDVEAITACTVALVPHTRLNEIFEEFPRLGRIYWFTNNMDAANHRHWSASIALLPAIERVANLFCEMYVRLDIVGLTDGLSFVLPMTQSELGECLGLTPVHINRVLRELRERDLLIFRRGATQIVDLGKLRALAGYDPAYLYLHPEPL